MASRGLIWACLLRVYSLFWLFRILLAEKHPDLKKGHNLDPDKSGCMKPTQIFFSIFLDFRPRLLTFATHLRVVEWVIGLASMEHPNYKNKSYVINPNLIEVKLIVYTILCKTETSDCRFYS